MSQVKSIAIKSTAKADMQTLESAEITLAKGISGDFRGSQPNRQVTILSESAWQKVCDSIDADLAWTIRRANLLVDGVEFSAADVGKTVRIGDVELKITRETSPCSRMDQQHQGLTAALTPDWRGGVCCYVISAGTIRIGDPVEIGF
jgi:MOSC domain-containing protein YiiM